MREEHPLSYIERMHGYQELDSKISALFGTRTAIGQLPNEINSDVVIVTLPHAALTEDERDKVRLLLSRELGIPFIPFGPDYPNTLAILPAELDKKEVTQKILQFNTSWDEIVRTAKNTDTQNLLSDTAYLRFMVTGDSSRPPRENEKQTRLKSLLEKKTSVKWDFSGANVVTNNPICDIDKSLTKLQRAFDLENESAGFIRNSNGHILIETDGISDAKLARFSMWPVNQTLSEASEGRGR